MEVSKVSARHKLEKKIVAAPRRRRCMLDGSCAAMAKDHHHHHGETETDRLIRSIPACSVSSTGTPQRLPSSGVDLDQHDDHPHSHRYRPLIYNSNRYALNPLRYSVFFILIIEALERFSYYGLVYTQTPFLTGVYDAGWNAGMSAIQASAVVAASTAIAFTAPFLGAWLADGIMGDYWVIVVGLLALYIPGTILIALSTTHLVGETFNVTALLVGLLFFYPVGAGAIKSVVNVFGAKQFHPVLQRQQISSYYVSFYMAINFGALCGGLLISTLAQSNVTVAYFTPVFMLCLGLLIFAAGTPRYVVTKGSMSNGTLKDQTTSSTNTFRSMLSIAGILALIVPFNVTYSQMATTFKVQGIVMKSALGGYLDAATMNNFDAISVLVCGYLVGSKFYPALAKRNVRMPTSYKFALGSLCGVLAMSCALLTEYIIRTTYAETGEEISVLWQTMSYALIGCGEIFCISAAYEVAFTIARHNQKAFASATNLFFVGGLPNILCIFLYRTCSDWFHTSNGGTSIQSISDYADSQVYNYFFLLLVIALFGTLLNLMPPVKRWVASIENARRDEEHEHEATSYSIWLKRQYTRRCDSVDVADGIP